MSFSLYAVFISLLIALKPWPQRKPEASISLYCHPYLSSLLLWLSKLHSFGGMWGIDKGSHVFHDGLKLLCSRGYLQKPDSPVCLPRSRTTSAQHQGPVKAYAGSRSSPLPSLTATWLWYDCCCHLLSSAFSSTNPSLSTSTLLPRLTTQPCSEAEPTLDDVQTVDPNIQPGHSRC